MKTKKVSVKIPAGVDEGTRLVLQGEGEAGLSGAASGDLYVFIHVHPHKHFQREGQTIYSLLEIPMTLAALGGEIEVETIHGPRTITVPHGTETGDTITLADAGVPHLRGKGQGDHVVRFVARTPKHLSKKQEELLREFASLSGETVAKKKKGIFS